MRRDSLCTSIVVLIIALLVAAQTACAQGVSGGYQAALVQYTQAHSAYEAQAEAYWNSVAEKRRARNAKRRGHEPVQLADYVLTQPPVYSGPPRPLDPNVPHPQQTEPKPELPVIADFLKAAAEQFSFVPQRPSESEFKRAYANAAQAAGLSKELIVGVYAFETGGNGTYDMQAGISPSRPDSRAISPAIGYNQLLSTNTVALLAEHGPLFLAALRQKAKGLNGAAQTEVERKIESVKRMIAFSHTVPDNWNDFDRLAKTTPGGFGIHAAILDRDLGPLLQVQKLLNSVRFARNKGHDAPLTAAELELMNLTGDGNGLDMVTMPQNFRARVPTANFFQQSGYERNPVARHSGTVAALLSTIEDKIIHASQSQGARELAAAF
jgi:hypothetical protein